MDTLTAILERLVLERTRASCPKAADRERVESVALNVLEFIHRETSDDNAMDIAEWVADNF